MVNRRERRILFHDDADRADFVARFAALRAGAITVCTKALLPRRAHLVVRPIQSIRPAQLKPLRHKIRIEGDGRADSTFPHDQEAHRTYQADSPLPCLSKMGYRLVMHPFSHPSNFECLGVAREMHGGLEAQPPLDEGHWLDRDVGVGEDLFP